MVGPLGSYAKRNRSNRERQIPYDFTHMWNIKKNVSTNETKQKHLRTENRVVVTRRQGEGRRRNG